MVETDLGQATIVYEGPDGDTVERTVQNEYVVYFQDHWMIKTGEDDEGRDLVQRIPHNRVYHVERTVEQFEREVSSIRNQVQSMADDLRSMLLGDEGRTTQYGEQGESEPIRIDVEDETQDEQ
ncbi:hypothetical protein [Haloarchaeobius sp. HRN-SO-5]|uniref:hypothetical protein n=1 Tax=Haloarchaeobius sp. HRN-SO-5 TaxID=3446118 RepID=UPI003EBD2E3A